MERSRKLEVPEQLAPTPEQLETIKLQNSIIAQLAEINAKLDFILKKQTEG